jgi:hypothetical protein
MPHRVTQVITKQDVGSPKENMQLLGQKASNGDVPEVSNFFP